MGLLRFNFRSQTIGHYVDVTVALPTDNYSYYDETKTKPNHHTVPGTGKKIPYVPGMKFQTVYMIHGGGDDDSLTYRYTNAELFAQRNHVMLVTPDISNSFGLDTEYGVNYFTFLTEELPVVIQTLFPSSPKREDNFIMGYAMGGNVVLGAALRRPDLYTTCVDISGGIGMTLDTEKIKEELVSDHFVNSFKLYTTAFPKPEEFDGSHADVYTVAKQHKENGDQLTKFYLCCGSEEFIRWRVEKDVEIMQQLGYDVDYICAEGYDHDFRMWNDYIEIGLDRLLPLKRQPIMPEE